MATRTIRENGDSILLKKCRRVTDFNNRLHILLDDMHETLIKANGVGLAAPQVGVLRRAVLVMDTSREDLTPEQQIVELINPVIVESDGEQTGPEGCLSVPGIFGLVTRPDHVKVKAQDRFGNEFEYEGTGLLARECCHEIDHLDGILFTERAEHILSEEELSEYYSRNDGDESMEEEN